MKSVPYVRVEYREAIDTKRELLSAQADILKILKLIQNYKELRKKELIKKNKLKIALNNLKKDMSNLTISLPEIQGISEIEIEPAIKEALKNKSIDAELKEIQDKLAQLEKH